MPRYKDGKMVEISKEEAERVENRMKKRMTSNKPMSVDYEKRIKALEDTVKDILSQLNKERANDKA